MIRVDSFHSTTTGITPSLKSMQQYGFESVNSNTNTANKFAISGKKVDVTYMLKKLEERGLISIEERKHLERDVRNRNQIVDKISDLKGPGLALNAAYKMRDGVLLPNGILTLTDDPRKVQRLSQLTANEVKIIETAEGSDMGIGQVGMLATTVSISKEQGIISGELGLKDFSMLKSWFEHNGKPDTTELIESQQMLKRLYDELSDRSRDI